MSVYALMQDMLEVKGLSERQVQEYMASKHVRWCESGLGSNPDLTVREHVQKYLEKYDAETELRAWGVWEDPAWSGHQFFMGDDTGNAEVQRMMDRLFTYAKDEMTRIARLHPEVREAYVRSAMQDYLFTRPMFEDQ